MMRRGGVWWLVEEFHTDERMLCLLERWKTVQQTAQFCVVMISDTHTLSPSS